MRVTLWNANTRVPGLVIFPNGSIIRGNAKMIRLTVAPVAFLFYSSLSLSSIPLPGSFKLVTELALPAICVAPHCTLQI